MNHLTKHHSNRIHPPHARVKLERKSEKSGEIKENYNSLESFKRKESIFEKVL